MAMGLYLEVAFKLPVMGAIADTKRGQLAKHRASHRSFVLLCHRPPRLTHSISVLRLFLDS
jgi:hypothetical protein